MKTIDYSSYSTSKITAKESGKKIAILSAVLIIFIMGMIYVANIFMSESTILKISTVYLVLLCPIALFAFFSRYYNKKIKNINDSFAEEFAKANNFTYSKSVPQEMIAGLYFTKGIELSTKLSNFATNLITITDNKNTFSIFEVRKYGKDDKKKTETIKTALVFNLNKTVPHICILTKDSILNQELNLKNTNEIIHLKISLPYENEHTTYGLRGEEIEALQLLDARLIELFEKYASSYDIEFINNYMIIYMDPLTHDLTLHEEDFKKKFEKILTLGNNFNIELEKQLNHFSFVPQGYAGPRQLTSTHFRNMLLIVVIFIVIFGTFFILAFKNRKGCVTLRSDTKMKIECNLYKIPNL